jgi:hypothetical protein
MMQTRDIPQDEWQPFLDTFTRLHQGEPLGIEIVGLTGAPRTALSRRPLVGVVAVPDCGNGACIEVVAGPQAEPQTRTIQHPSHLSVTERDDGYPMVLQITDNNGAVTLIRLEPAPYSNKPPGHYLG